MIDLKPYLQQNKRHEYYTQSVERYNALYSHNCGEYTDYIKKLIEERRPAEDKKIHAYRSKIFISNTTGYFNRVISSLQKIRKSFDYNIAFEPSDAEKRIPKEETLREYTTENYPKFTSLDNWYWSIGMTQQLIDSGGVILMDVVNKKHKDNEFRKVYSYVYNSNQVWDYKENEYYFLESNEYYEFMEKGVIQKGKVFYHVTRTNVDRYYQVNLKNDFAVEEYVHGLGYVPVISLHGIVDKSNLNNSLCSSRLEPMLPFLKEAIREYSDLQAEVVQHVHSTMWAVSANECKECNGSGVIVKQKTAGGKGGSSKCGSCNGRGVYPFDSYEHLSLKAGTFGESNFPTPPAGYITKPTDIVKIQAERVVGHIHSALAAINYEWLMATPLNQSGTAKEVDRSELNNFVYAVAEDAIRVIDEMFKMVNDYRYMSLIPEKEKRDEMLPHIEVPQRYDIITDAMIASDIKAMIEAKFSPRIIVATQIEYINKRFQANPDISKQLSATFLLDPLSGTNEEDLSIQKMNGGVDELDYIVHCNIKKFLETCLQEDKEFLSKPYNEQTKKIYSLAEAQLNKGKASSKVADIVNNSGQVDTNQSIVETESDVIGKLPLALQQLGLAATRAREAGNVALGKKIEAKMNELVLLIE